MTFTILISDWLRFQILVNCPPHEGPFILQENFFMNPVYDEVNSIKHYMIKFVSDLRQVGGFLRVLQFPPPIKLTATIDWLRFQILVNCPPHEGPFILQENFFITDGWFFKVWFGLWCLTPLSTIFQLYQSCFCPSRVNEESLKRTSQTSMVLS
jgi:hypothetical protein